MPTEVGVEVLVGIDAQIFADDLDGQDLRVGELGLGTALAQLSSFEPIVDEAENGDDEGALRSTRSGDPLYAGWLEAPPSVARVSVFALLLKETCTSG